MSRVNLRQGAERRGRVAETLCTLVLRAKGYRVLERHWRTRQGEIDIVARRGRIVAFVEVKARGDRLSAAEALRPKQRQRIVRSAQQFMASRPQLAGCDLRFDVMLVTPWRWPAHLPNAWLVAA